MNKFLSLFVIFLYTSFGYSQNIEYTEYKLENGLSVIIHQDNSAPVIATEVMYHVGSRDEIEGKSGFSHFFEHMCASSSANTPNIEKRKWKQIIASKGGVAQLTKALSNEWSSEGVNVNAIAPGYISTELTDEMIAGESGRKWIERNTPLRRPGDVSELDGAMLLLSSDAGSYITGETIAVDGGWLAR